MQLYVADYMADTRHLTCEQDGAYMRLLMAMWRSGGSLSADAAKLARICGLTATRWTKISPDVMAFFDLAEGLITQGRLTKEIKKAEEKSSKRSECGKLGGLAKSLKNNKPTVAKASDLLKHSIEPELEPEEDSKPPVSPNGETAPTGAGPSPKKARSKSAGSERATRLPESWDVTEELLTFAETLGMTRKETCDAAAEFRDYWGSRGDTRARKLNWNLTFQVRLREVAARSGANRRTLAEPDARRANTDSRRDAWVSVVARRRASQTDPDPDGGSGGGGEGGGSAYPRLAYAGDGG